MQDLKKNKKRIANHQNKQMDNNVIEQEKHEEEEYDELNRGCGSKQKSQCSNNNNNGCNTNHNNGCNTNHNDCDCDCDCGCNTNHHNNCGCNTKPKCEPCEAEEKDCVDNKKCGPECGNPLVAPKFSTANSVPFAIEANRVFDTMMFQTFTDAIAPNGEALSFEYDVVEVRGRIPRSGQVNVTIEKICMNYSGVVIDPGCTTLEDYDLQPLDPEVGRPCETNFEYAVCGEKNIKCCNQGKGKNVVYKQRGLTVTVEDLVLELRGKCGCTEITVFAYPAVRGLGGQTRRCEDVEFIFNTLSAPICLPADGRSATLRQDFQTDLTVDCIGKAILKCVDDDPCESYYDLCIPNDIDLVLCLQCVVSTLINEQIVVLGSSDPVKPRLVDTFNKVCDFKTCGPKNDADNNHNGGCGCSR
ncbi:hypothetical protein QOZ84_04920 [Romboutsia sedimentorum]|uniref:DUF3794 domain-containing protein n=1 Tax=Romboutsia sedimentorum TaxID=1368474 RepID=A0ABT7E864_9FIRM|nr:hypothetical protein [Romboutsia sedimentorum]MDK2562882.1 hypothetical protein [Romboutsia sedimentorum]